MMLPTMAACVQPTVPRESRPAMDIVTTTQSRKFSPPFFFTLLIQYTSPVVRRQNLLLGGMRARWVQLPSGEPDLLTKHLVAKMVTKMQPHFAEAAQEQDICGGRV
jgi:hypothetical protein